MSGGQHDHARPTTKPKRHIEKYLDMYFKEMGMWACDKWKVDKVEFAAVEVNVKNRTHGKLLKVGVYPPINLLRVDHGAWAVTHLN